MGWHLYMMFQRDLRRVWQKPGMRRSQRARKPPAAAPSPAKKARKPARQKKTKPLEYQPLQEAFSQGGQLLSQSEFAALPAKARRPAEAEKQRRVALEALREAFVRGEGSFDRARLDVPQSKSIAPLQAQAARFFFVKSYDTWGGVWPTTAGPKALISAECKRIGIEPAASSV